MRGAAAILIVLGLWLAVWVARDQCVIEIKQGLVTNQAAGHLAIRFWRPACVEEVKK